MKMKAAIVRQHNQPASIEEIDLAAPKASEVLIKTAYTGFCHSDLYMMEGVFGIPLPLVLGHEAAGVVEDVGPGVTSLAKGDHVVATWYIACGYCPECRAGRGNICRTNFELHALGGLQDRTSRLSDKYGARLNHQTNISGFAEYMVVPEPAAIKIQEDLPLDQACLLGCCQPTGFGAVYNATDMKPGYSAAIWGMGGVGLNVVRGAKLRLGNPIIAVDIQGAKESIAREFGATHFINSSKEDPVPIIQELTNGGADYCFEAIGDPGAIVQAYWSLGMGGKLVMIGNTRESEMTGLPLFYHPLHCKTIEGALYGNIDTKRDIPALADMAVAGDLLLDKLITRRFKVEEINDIAKEMTRHEILGRAVCSWE
jgi:S-(hydroxymethyl)glutathione dehydrogenase / alcohol dehydrogenase